MELSTIGKSQFNPLSAKHVYIRAGHDITRVYRIVKIEAFLIRSRLHGCVFRIQRSILYKNQLFGMVGRRFDFVETSPRNLEIRFFFVENLVFLENAWHSKG